MDIKISNAGGVPIYEQIVSQVKAKIIAGELREGDALPSMLSLIHISPLATTWCSRATPAWRAAAPCSA